MNLYSKISIQAPTLIMVLKSTLIRAYTAAIQKQPGSFILSHKPTQKNQYLLSLLIVSIVSAICYLFTGYIGSEVVAFILLLALSFIAMFFDILPVMFAALLSALVWDYFFLLPRFNLRVGNTEDKIMLSMYFVIALINAVLTFKIRQIEKIARHKEEKANTIKLYNTLLNSLSHEFRTPIAAIIAATDNLLNNPTAFSGDDKNNLVAEISTAALRLNQQVENLLNMSRLESGFLKPKKDWCDVNELIYSVVQRLDENVENHMVDIEVPENLPLFKIDHGLIEQVLRNLIFNATQYTPSGSFIQIKAQAGNDCLVLSVQDNGPGFPEAEIEKVFGKFYRVPHSKIGGTGLGLSIVKGFVEAHKGEVSLHNVLPCGAKFTIIIPAEQNAYKPDEK